MAAGTEILALPRVNASEIRRRTNQESKMESSHTPSPEEASLWSEDGTRVGRVVAFYVLDEDDTPAIAGVATADSDVELVVPVLYGAEFRGTEVVAPYPYAQIMDGPVAEPESLLSVGEVQAVFSYYDAGEVRGVDPLITRRSEETTPPDSGTDTGPGTDIGIGIGIGIGTGTGTGTLPDIPSSGIVVRKLPPIVTIRPSLEAPSEPAHDLTAEE
jgi:hypothetical protein